MPRLLSMLEALPGADAGPRERSTVWQARRPRRYSAGDAFIISYADMLRGKGLPLETLADFAERRIAGCFTDMHLLPFFPSSSDEGFSVIDYGSVDPRLGDWRQIARLGRNFDLAFDLVLNHASAQGAWFRGFLGDKKPFTGFFLTRPKGYDDSSVFRPRIHPLLTPYRRDDGTEILVWTTFSPDQADLDYSDPEVLLAMIGIALSYVARGARTLRLDAIAFAWKEDGTDCLDRPQVHSIVRLFRAVLDEVAPGVSLLSETNLPQPINDSYFGKGDEAHLVYNFSLPPLALHAFVSGNAGFLASWAANLPRPTPGRTYINFLSSHDGIGLAPARGLLPPREIDRLVSATLARGGLVSERATSDGPVPYELNTTFLDAIAVPGATDEAQAHAFLSCHAIMASLAGIPAIWFHSLVGSRNWREGPALTGSKRSIHRERLYIHALERELDDPATIRFRAYTGLSALLDARGSRNAFDPASPQLVLSPDGSGEILPGSSEADNGRAAGRILEGPLFAILRGVGSNAVLAVANVSDSPARCVLPRTFSPAGSPFDPAGGPGAADAGKPSLDRGCLLIPPLGTAWLDGSLQGG